MKLFSKLLKIAGVLFPFRILAKAHGNDDVREEFSVAAVDVSPHFLLRSERRPAGVLLGRTPDLVYLRSNCFSLSCRQAIWKVQETMGFLQLRQRKNERGVGVS